MLGEFGWISEPGGIVRMTKYTADRQGYRVRHITRDLERETNEKEKGEVVAQVQSGVHFVYYFMTV